MSNVFACYLLFLSVLLLRAKIQRFEDTENLNMGVLNESRL